MFKTRDYDVAEKLQKDGAKLVSVVVISVAPTIIPGRRQIREYTFDIGENEASVILGDKKMSVEIPEEGKKSPGRPKKK